MRISNKQAELLAKEIFDRLKKTNVSKLSPELLSKLRAYKKQRDKLFAEKDKLEKEIQEWDKQLTGIVGKSNINKIRGYWDEENIIEKLEEVNTPTLQEIEDKIILKSMFTSEEDMEQFVEKLVNDFQKKKVKL